MFTNQLVQDLPARRLLVGCAGLAIVGAAALFWGSPAKAVGGPARPACNWGTYATAGTVRTGGDCISPSNSFQNAGGNIASASAVLDGSLHAMVISASSPTSCNPIFPNCWWGSTASAYIHEKIVFRANEEKTIKVGLAIDGSLDQGTLWGQAGGTAWYSFSTDKNAASGAAPIMLDGSNVNSSQMFTLKAEEETIYYLFMGISVYANRSGSVDYGNTIRFLWDLPEGVTYSSSSGYFAPQRLTPLPETPETPAVPEPASWVMLVAGFGFVGANIRRRRPGNPKSACN